MVGLDARVGLTVCVVALVALLVAGFVQSRMAAVTKAVNAAGVSAVSK